LAGGFIIFLSHHLLSYVSIYLEKVKFTFGLVDLIRLCGCFLCFKLLRKRKGCKKSSALNIALLMTWQPIFYLDRKLA